MSESSKGEKNPNYMKSMTEEQKKKISEAKTGVVTIGTKAVLQYDINGNFIRKWNLISQASKELKICANTISYCCKGKYKTAGGFIWRYADKLSTQQND